MARTLVTNKSDGVFEVPGLPVLGPGHSAVVSGSPASVLAAFGGDVAVGSFLTFTLVPDTTPISPTAAPLAAANATTTQTGYIDAASFARLTEDHTQQALVDALTITPDGSAGRHMTLLTTGAVGATRQLLTMANPQIGPYWLDVTAHAASGVGLTFDASYTGSNGGTPVLTGTSGAKDLLAMYWNGSKMVVQMGSANHG